MAPTYITSGNSLGSDFDETLAIGGTSVTASITNYKMPPTVIGLPRLSSGQHDGDTLTMDVSGLASVSAYEWRVYGGAVLGTAPTLDSTGLGGTWVVCAVSHAGGETLSLPFMVYANMSMASHNVDDAAIAALTPYNDATNHAITDGDWSNPLSWADGRIPRSGARVIIPHDIEVNYDLNEPLTRLDWVRVDGTLTWAMDRSTTMLVEHLVGTRGSQILMGTSDVDRLPQQHSLDVVISGRHYRYGTKGDSNMNLARDPRLWGRGIITQGTWRLWGFAKQKFCRSTHTASFNGTSWDFVGVRAGDTSLTLDTDQHNWALGDTIVISGTAIDYAGSGNPVSDQDETRVLTYVNGFTLGWDDPLDHHHDNQLPGSTRTDLNPVVMLKKGSNITIRSEATDLPHRRGHTACVHGMAVVDLWDGDFVNLGRTNKAVPSGVIESDQFKVYTDGPIPVIVALEPLTSVSNLQSRYPVHMHHVGFSHVGARPVVNSCHVEGSPGWGMVHHSCDADFFNNSMHNFFGAGMVAESGNELGAWVNNLALHTTCDRDVVLTSSPKVRGDPPDLAGDNFRHGYGFAMRGRAMRTNLNVAVSVFWGFVWYHRKGGSVPTTISLPVDLDRAHLDVKTMGLLRDGDPASDEFSFVDYPIIHMAKNEAIACYGGVFVTKAAPNANHDLNVVFKDFKAWGIGGQGITQEYVGSYANHRADLIAGPTGSPLPGAVGSNSWQLGFLNSSFEGGSYGLNLNGGDPQGPFHDNFNNTVDPRWWEVGNDYVDNGTGSISYADVSGTKTGPDVTYSDPDYDGTAVDFSADPSEDFPLVVGEWDGTTTFGGAGTLTSWPDNTDGNKSDNLSASGEVAFKKYGPDDGFFVTDITSLRRFKDVVGFWQYGGNDVIVQRDIISDRITGRPHKFVKLWTCTNTPSGTDNGAFAYAATPVAASDVTVAVTGSSASFNVLTGATGGSGVYDLDLDDHIAPDFGTVTLAANGDMVYTPDRGYVGTDSMYIFVHSEGRYKTRRVSFLIGAGGAVSTPAVTTHFTATDHADANTIGVQLASTPDCGGRDIWRTEYSTDSGTTWRRLCTGWKQAVHKVTVESDGTAIAAGAYNVRIRYHTDYDEATSSASGDDAVTVS